MMNMSILSLIKPAPGKIFWFFLAIAVFSIGLGFFVEYVIKIPPCNLCLFQRIPYYVIGVVSTFALIAKRWYGVLRVLVVISILSSIGLSAYHSGVEEGFFRETSLCNPDVQIPDNMTSEQVKEMLYNRDVATCTKPPFKIMFLSMTEWNFLFNIGLLVLSLIYFRLERDAQAILPQQ
ncbi:MAG: disulfide bond formation protein B [Rickettsiaceae bacterium]|nr:disulfide bond formation protein B [Rickettsiaceae bacterium]